MIRARYGRSFNTSNTVVKRLLTDVSTLSSLSVVINQVSCTTSLASTVICIIWVPKPLVSVIEKYHIPLFVALQDNSPIPVSKDNQVGIDHPIAQSLIYSKYTNPLFPLFSCILQGDSFVVSFVFSVDITLVTLVPIVSPTYPLVTYILPLIVNGEKSDA